MKQGVIVAKRHLNLPPTLAKKYGLKDLDIVAVHTKGTRPVIFHEVVVLSRPDIDALAIQIDTDEANAAGISTGQQAVAHYG